MLISVVMTICTGVGRFYRLRTDTVNVVKTGAQESHSLKGEHSDVILLKGHDFKLTSIYLCL